MRIGAIDCGTNSLRLLIADVETQNGVSTLHDIVRLMRIVRLGEGVDATGKFSEEALERTFNVAREYAQIIAEHGVQSLRFGATSATRDATNKDIFIQGIQDILGVSPEVITGDEEAKLSFYGALSSLDPYEGKTLVIDLGGGSTEFVLGDNQSLFAARSVNIGCVRLTERHQVSAPMTEEQKQRIIADVEEALEEALAHVQLSQAQRVVGVAGTVTTIVAEHYGLESYDPRRINGAELSIQDIEQACHSLAQMTAEERAGRGFMHPGRVDVIGTGAVIWAHIIRRLEQLTGGAVYSATASEHDILDGLVLSQR
ncbi:exopolyphosphatase [Rothia sp. CCM 9419]|uniref:Ppx/GppA phosphatase family protein n=1 Tax=Rothia sp. CCM 9419 TaxID=3402662 RepID=UPI003ADD8759